MELTGCPIECPAEVIDAVEKLLTLMCEPLVVTSGEELERYEREVREQTDRVCALVVGHRIQFSLDSEQLQELQGRWVKAFAHKLKNKGGSSDKSVG